MRFFEKSFVFIVSISSAEVSLPESREAARLETWRYRWMAALNGRAGAPGAAAYATPKGP